MSSGGDKVCLVVIDGWGVSPGGADGGAADGAGSAAAGAPCHGDAIRHAETPVMDRLRQEGAATELQASGRAVGLPEGLMGNSEVGHLNIGAGRVVYQDIVRIDLAIETGAMQECACLVDAFARAASSTAGRVPRLHLVGLVSDGGVHSHIAHLLALLSYARAAGVPRLFVHAITDGRDTAPKSAVGYLRQLNEHLVGLSYEDGLATVIGRYYAMDRDRRWERTTIALDALTGAHAARCDGQQDTAVVLPQPASFDSLVEEIARRYEGEERDEFLRPIIVNPRGAIEEGDCVVFFNYRSDRMRQLAASFAGCLSGGGAAASEASEVGPDFRPARMPTALSAIVTMTEYSAKFPFPVISPPQRLTNVLAEWLALKGVAQYHGAETEKYAHVTFFFNGGREEPFEGEDRELIPSPRVATYDLQPEMSVAAVADAIIAAMGSPRAYPFVMCNFAPPDMVGHTGKFGPTVQAVEATDRAIGRVWKAARLAGYTLVVTSDHGNAEQMLAADGGEHTAHTCEPVPLLVARPPPLEGCHGEAAVVAYIAPPAGRLPALCDVAPTVLSLMGLEKAPEMTGCSLFRVMAREP